MLAGANDLLVLAVGFLLASIPLYALVGMARTPRAAEAAMKTYLLGALFGITLLLGVTVLYGVAGTTAYAALAARPRRRPGRGGRGRASSRSLAGLMFKAGGVPGALLGARRRAGRRRRRRGVPHHGAQGRRAGRGLPAASTRCPAPRRRAAAGRGARRGSA